MYIYKIKYELPLYIGSLTVWRSEGINHAGRRPKWLITSTRTTKRS